MGSVNESASWAMTNGARVFGPGGVVEQLLDGEIPMTLEPVDGEAQMARRLRQLGEAVRMGRATLNGDSSSEYPTWPEFAHPLTGQPKPRQPMPINRKERFYTATVLPAIITAGRAGDLDLFLEMCGVPLQPRWETKQEPWLEVVTEYNLMESATTSEEKELFGTHALKGDTPDVILAGEDWLVVIEAKMFHRPSKADLAIQFENQKPIVAALARGTGISVDRVRHGFLLVNADQAPACGDFVITWQQVIDAYTGVGPAYWVEALRRAVANYEHLQSKTTSNAEGRHSGEEILMLLRSDPELIRYVGRSGGLQGTDFANDITTGNWRSVVYQTRSAPIPASNRNWMSAADFKTAIEDAEHG